MVLGQLSQLAGISLVLSLLLPREMPIKDLRMSGGWWALPVVPVHGEAEAGVRDQCFRKSKGETKVGGSRTGCLFLYFLTMCVGGSGLY